MPSVRFVEFYPPTLSDHRVKLNFPFFFPPPFLCSRPTATELTAFATTSQCFVCGLRNFISDSVNNNNNKTTYLNNTYIIITIMVNNTPKHNGKLSTSIVSGDYKPGRGTMEAPGIHLHNNNKNITVFFFCFFFLFRYSSVMTERVCCAVPSCNGVLYPLIHAQQAAAICISTNGIYLLSVDFIKSVKERVNTRTVPKPETL